MKRTLHDLQCRREAPGRCHLSIDWHKETGRAGHGQDHFVHGGVVSLGSGKCPYRSCRGIFWEIGWGRAASHGATADHHPSKRSLIGSPDSCI